MPEYNQFFLEIIFNVVMHDSNSVRLIDEVCYVWGYNSCTAVLLLILMILSLKNLLEAVPSSTT
jgi:hypothetical protein